MWAYLWIILGCGTLLSVVIVLASKNGSKAAQLEALKAELRKQIEEQARAKQITDNVYSLSNDDARRRLQAIANDQKRDSVQ